MDSDLLTPFVELEEDFCSTRGLDSCVSPQLRPAGLQRRHSHCPITLPNSRMNSSEVPGPWGPILVEQRWSRELACSALSHIPFRMDRSVSMIEGPALPPPPGLTPSALAPRTLALSTQTPSDLSPEMLCRLPSSPLLSPRYKTELCRTFQENGACKYGAKCQFAHGSQELRGLSRHPKYKTEPCRTFHTIGFCPYGARCHFIHNADELCLEARRPGGPTLRHSISFSGVSSGTAPVLTRACSMSPPPLSVAGSPDSLYTSPLLPEPGALKHFSYPLSSLLDSGDDLALHFCAVPEQGPGALWRCSSQDSVSECVSECVSEEGYVSSGSRSQSPCEPPRLPIFSQMSTSEHSRLRLDQD
ncbi:mRNA decay activator protein ZFP36L1 [Periophthalmus magnuspinnatus]|uniref:mRNA decay activator protein ZFP36L1 n=1 Tax=Periophthalmus magnuspinnatus TaxID=409849 RepID=UPI00145A690C|nr:mRNA decay activator protein ZFP36L1 [Periophthalmus magnuspinnatus]